MLPPCCGSLDIALCFYFSLETGELCCGNVTPQPQPHSPLPLVDFFYLVLPLPLSTICPSPIALPHNPHHAFQSLNITSYCSPCFPEIYVSLLQCALRRLPKDAVYIKPASFCWAKSVIDEKNGSSTNTLFFLFTRLPSVVSAPSLSRFSRGYASEAGMLPPSSSEHDPEQPADRIFLQRRRTLSLSVVALLATSLLSRLDKRA